MRFVIMLGLLAAVALPAIAQAELPDGWNKPKRDHVEQRTAGREVAADLHPWPDWMMDRPQYFEFTPMISNHDAQNQHPGQWAGQEWDTAKWPRGWTAQKALEKFKQGGIFAGYNAKDRDILLGPTFYKLSQLDQNRTLKLLTDQTGAFAQTPAPVLLRDHVTREIIGSYSPTGLQMN